MLRLNKEKEKIKDILKTYNFNKYCQHHIQYYDLTEEIGNYGDYKILLVKVEQEWNNKAIKYYLFVDHKANVNIWELDRNMEIIKEMI